MWSRRERTRGAHDRQLTSMPIDFQIRTELRDPFQHRPLQRALHEVRACACNPFPELLLIRFVRFAKGVTIAIVTVTTLDDIDAVL